MILKTQRLILRDLEPYDLEIFFNYRSNKELCKFQDFMVLDIEKAQQFIQDQKSVTIGQENEWKQIAIALADNTLIGDCAIKFLEYENRIAELGCTLSGEYHNKGFATEALDSLMRFVFDKYDIHKFIANVDIRNLGSQRMVEKLGFQKEGQFRKHYWDKNDNEWFDEIHFGLLRSDLS